MSVGFTSHGHFQPKNTHYENFIAFIHADDDDGIVGLQ